MERTFLIVIAHFFFLTAFSQVAGNPLGIINQQKPANLIFNDTILEELVWLTPFDTPGKVGKYEKLELGFELPKKITQQVNYFLLNGKGGINPFDPDAIDFRVELTAPDGSKITRFGFYFAPFSQKLSGSSENMASLQNEFIPEKTRLNWRFRFAPNLEGEWKIAVKIRVAGFETITLPEGTFQCEKSNHKGLLSVSQTTTEKDRWLFYSETNEPFFAVSENIASAGECGFYPSQLNRQLDGIQKLVDAGGNFTRFELGGQAALPDWPTYNNYASKLDEMFAFDQVVEKCEKNHVYFTLFRHHVEVMDRGDWANVRWELNPYKVGMNCTIEEYFTKPEIIKWQNNCLRYIFSRWGYSSNMAFYSYSEVDNWYTKLLENKTERDAKKNAVVLLRNWISDQQKFIESNLNSTILFCHSPARLSDLENNPETSFFSLSDVIGLHSYGERKEINYSNRYDKIETYWNKFKKPVILEEMGPNKIAMYCCTGIEFHNSIWSSAFMGCFGTGMDWWWDSGVFDANYQKDLAHIQRFFSTENLREGNYSPQKWKDASIKNSMLENFALQDEKKEHVIGWIHNATFYWRNLADSNPCLINLVDEKTDLNTPCYFSKDPYGYSFSMLGKACPIEHNSVYEHEDLTGFDHPKLKDKYTDKGGAQTIQNSSGMRQNPTFKLKELKTSGLNKKHWYTVEYYFTEGEVAGKAPIEAQTISTNALGTLEVNVPNLDFNHPDYAYKVTYLGYYR